MKKNFKITRRKPTYKTAIYTLANTRYALLMDGYRAPDADLRSAYYIIADLFNKDFERVVNDAILESERIAEKKMNA
jgi:hypothetical protein